MANWNSGAYFNKDVNEYGFMWNGAEWVTLKNMREAITMSDGVPRVLALLALSEGGTVRDDMDLSAQFSASESFTVGDHMTYRTLFELTDSLGITDAVTDLVVLAYLTDNSAVLDDVRLFAELLTEDGFGAKDVSTVEAFLKLAQDFKLEELAPALEAFIPQHEEFGVTDHAPKKAVSDFIIGAYGDLDRAYDWLIPFGLRMDWSKTSLPIMPEAELTTIEMPGVDGSIVADTTYRDRLFKLVGYSVDGLTTPQKEELKRKLTAVLDATKHQTKKLTVQARGTVFDVKYTDELKIDEGPSYIRAEIPLHTGPYGRDMFDQELSGSGLVYNEGAIETGVTHIITGAVNSPAFTLGAVNYRYNGNIPKDCTLTIDHDKYTVFLTDPFGNKTNALKDFVGDFQQIPAGKSAALTADENTEAHILTKWVNRVLW